MELIRDSVGWCGGETLVIVSLLPSHHPIQIGMANEISQTSATNSRIRDFLVVASVELSLAVAPCHEGGWQRSDMVTERPHIISQRLPSTVLCRCLS